MSDMGREERRANLERAAEEGRRERAAHIVLDGILYRWPWRWHEVEDALAAIVKHHMETNHPGGGEGFHAECDTCRVVFYSKEALRG